MNDVELQRHEEVTQFARAIAEHLPGFQVLPAVEPDRVFLKHKSRDLQLSMRLMFNRRVMVNTTGVVRRSTTLSLARKPHLAARQIERVLLMGLDVALAAETASRISVERDDERRAESMQRLRTALGGSTRVEGDTLHWSTLGPSVTITLNQDGTGGDVVLKSVDARTMTLIAQLLRVGA